jgi:hypothetical protein
LESPASRLLIYGTLFTILIAMAFGFFAMTGGGVRSISGHFGMGLSEVLYEPPKPPAGSVAAGAVVVPTAPVRRVLDMPRVTPETFREQSVPETKAEEQYYSAIQKLHELEGRQAQRLKGRDEILRFLETPLGRDLRAIAELARRGRTREAGESVQKVIGAMGELSPRIQTYALKLAIQIYKTEKDQAGLSWALKRYLELTRDSIVGSRDDQDSDRDSAGSRAEVEELVRRVGTAAPGSGR